MRCSTAVIVVPALLAMGAAARADVKISSATTANMTCSGSICAPTAKNAVLNVGDLETLLASGNAEVTTTGSAAQAGTIVVQAPLTWSNSAVLSLDAYETILVEKPVSLKGQGGLSIATNDGGKNGYFGFRRKGQVTFANLSGALTVNGAAYTLVSDIAALASDIAANSAGNYALANDYDAGNDGTYQNSPIPTEFGGAFEGLGNTISNLSMNGTGDINAPVGLFSETGLNNGAGGAIENISLLNLSISGNGFSVGGLVGINTGTIAGAFVSGYAESGGEPGLSIGLLAGFSGGSIVRSGAVGIVASSQTSGAGGLVSSSTGSITQSYADCKVSGGNMSVLGGLAAGTFGSSSLISQSYAMGTVIDASGSVVGGLVGENKSTITQSYSTTALRNVGRRDRDAGGLIGIDDAKAGSITSSYWDLSTSHIKNLKDGAGTPRHDSGITGLTTGQLQSGLPKGFDPKVWAENPQINNGLPYLIDNPPEK